MKMCGIIEDYKNHNWLDCLFELYVEVRNAVWSFINISYSTVGLGN
jgi:hypothetical protein